VNRKTWAASAKTKKEGEEPPLISRKAQNGNRRGGGRQHFRKEEERLAARSEEKGKSISAQATACHVSPGREGSLESKGCPDLMVEGKSKNEAFGNQKRRTGGERQRQEPKV